MYAKKGTFPSGIFVEREQKKPFVLLDNEIS